MKKIKSNQYRALIKDDLAYNWHPYTQMKECSDFPPIIAAKANGAKIFDIDGIFYYDVISSWWCNIHGHNHPVIKRAIRSQIQRLEHVLFAGFTHEGAVKLSKALARVAPGNLRRIFYSDNGSTAVETALKMSYQFWRNTGAFKKRKFVSLENGYHGDTVGAMSVGGVTLFHETFKSLLFHTYKVPQPPSCDLDGGYDKKKYDRSLGYLRKIISKNHSEIAALIIEPLVMAAGGMIMYPGEYLKEAAVIAKKYNVHLIVDEVATGFGRTGEMFACEHVNVSPDFLCLSKGLTSGYLPLGATITTEKVYKAFYADFAKGKTFYHGHTFTANPVACAAAYASLSLFSDNAWKKKTQMNTELIRKRLRALGKYPFVSGLRSRGMIGAFDVTLLSVGGRRKRDMRGCMMEFYRTALKKNLILRPLGNVLYVYLPLCVTPYQVNDIFDRIESVLTIMKKKV